MGVDRRLEGTDGTVTLHWQATRLRAAAAGAAQCRCATSRRPGHGSSSDGTPVVALLAWRWSASSESDVHPSHDTYIRVIMTRLH